MRPTARGAVRGALVAIHNLTTLLESPRVARATVDEVLPEALAGAHTLRTVFLDAGLTPAKRGLAEFVNAILERFEATASDFRSSSRGVKERLAFERLANVSAHELDVAGELLELSCRTADPQATHLAADDVLRDALSSAFEFVAPTNAIAYVTRTLEGCSVYADPLVLRRLFALVVAVGVDWAARDQGGVASVTLEPAYDDSHVSLLARKPVDADRAVAPIAIRTFRSVGPTLALFEEAAAASGAVVHARSSGFELRLARNVATA
ncbi:MAG: hypothetical protein U0169_09380 [Polyangiaceae bacterium]